MKYTWKATAEQKANENGDVVTVYKYEITHEDSTVTHRTVTEANGERKMEEYKIAAPAQPPAQLERKPIQPPQDMPEYGTFDARRVIFKDEDGVETTTINYTVYTEDGKWWQKEIHKEGYEVEVTRGPVEELTDEDRATVFAPSTSEDQEPQAVLPKPSASAVNEKTDAKAHIKRIDASSSKPVKDAYLLACQKNDRSNEPAANVSRSIKARGSVADRYLKNLK